MSFYNETFGKDSRESRRLENFNNNQERDTQYYKQSHQQSSAACNKQTGMFQNSGMNSEQNKQNIQQLQQLKKSSLNLHAQQQNQQQISQTQQQSTSLKMEDREILKRLRALEQSQNAQEEINHKVINLENKLQKMSEKYSKFDQYVKTIESNTKIMDNFKDNIDAKFMLFEERLQQLTQKVNDKSSAKNNDKNQICEVSFASEPKDENNLQQQKNSDQDLFQEINNLYKLVRKSIASQKEMFEEITHLKRMMRSDRENSVSSQMSNNFRGGNNSGLKSSLLKSNSNSLRNSSTLINQIGQRDNSSSSNLHNQNNLYNSSLIQNQQNKNSTTNLIMKTEQDDQMQDQQQLTFEQKMLLQKQKLKMQQKKLQNSHQQDNLSNASTQLSNQREALSNLSNNYNMDPTQKLSSNCKSTYSQEISESDPSEVRKRFNNYQSEIERGTSQISTSKDSRIDKQEIERRKQKIDNEINRRLVEDREKRKRNGSNDKENNNLKFNDTSKGANLQQQSGNYKENYNSSSSERQQQLAAQEKNKKWEFQYKNQEHKYYVQTNRINLK